MILWNYYNFRYNNDIHVYAFFKALIFLRYTYNSIVLTDKMFWIYLKIIQCVNRCEGQSVEGTINEIRLAIIVKMGGIYMRIHFVNSIYSIFVYA